jgi:hypothetical protein
MGRMSGLGRRMLMVLAGGAILTGGGLVLPAAAQTPSTATLNWIPATELRLEGRGWSDTATTYHRLPARARDQVTSSVWTLAAHTSGLVLRFVTDSPTIAAQWDGGEPMNHMAATGSHGLDLYSRPWTEGSGAQAKPGRAGSGAQAEKQAWRYVATGRPKAGFTTAVLVRDQKREAREYLLYLPTYGRVTSVSLGLAAGSMVKAGPARPEGEGPLVFYGTSITQGGCASRSGMGHTAILGRWLDREVINLGFSGSGKSEPGMIRLVAELKGAVFVLEPLPNMTTEQVRERMGPALEEIRRHHPKAPVLLVSNPLLSDDHPQNVALRQVFEAKRKGDRALVLLPSKGQLDGRENGTVDGVHPTDLGFLRMAEAYEPVLRRLLKR